VYYTVQEANGYVIYRHQRDGGETRMLSVPWPRNTLSPEENWAVSGGRAIPVGGGAPVQLCKGCLVTWGANGRSMLFHYRAVMGDKNVSVQIPCKPDALPALPASGVDGLGEAAALPGARVIRSDGPAAAAGSVYAYVETNRHLNIFRITLP